MVVYYAPGGDGYFSAAQNSLVHVFMYSYYFFVTLGIQVPYKKYITQIQMLQFVLNLVQALYHLLTNAPYPKFLAQTLLIYMITLLVLFYNFYQKNLAQQRADRVKQKKTE